MNHEEHAYTPKPPSDALYEVRFHRLAPPETWFGTWARQALPEDAKAEALEILKNCGQDPEHYDLDHPVMVALKPDF
jgi:hypothetical protein